MSDFGAVIILDEELGKIWRWSLLCTCAHDQYIRMKPNVGVLRRAVLPSWWRV